MKLALACACLLLYVGAQAQLTDAEKTGLRDSLYLRNLGPEDLKFERKVTGDPLRMAAIATSLDDPVGFADELLVAHAAGAETTSMSGLIEQALKWYELPLSPAPADGAAVTSDLPVGLSGPINKIVQALKTADGEVRAAISSLTADEVRSLIETLPVWAVEEPKVRFTFVKSSPLPKAKVLELLAKVDCGRIRAAALRLALAIEQQVPTLLGNKDPIVAPLKTRIGGLVVVIGSRGDDLHADTDARLTIDLGGNDTYSGRHGAGIGYSGVMIDASGDDTYRLPDASLGAGLVGIGLGWDLSGDDDYRTASVALGCGLAGVGAFWDAKGSDTYRSKSLSQGFGQFGVGTFKDSGGDDFYQIGLFGQGASRTQGVGWMIDGGGNDVYAAGGVSMNEPLFTGVSYSFAQGFSSGYREDTGGVSGGIGLLTDVSGSDHYAGDTYMQASSYWYAVGSLADLAGNDSYTGHHYDQASAMHLCTAFLFDLAGRDSYTTKYGASLAIGHDYGVAMLLDREGDDIYVAQDSSPGTGNANGLGIFIDSSGSDRYDGPPGLGNPARGSGSLGVFVDLGGPDKYRTGLADNGGAVGSDMGVALDTDPGGAAQPIQTPPHQRPKPGTAPRPSDNELEDTYKLATQWGVGSAAESTEKALDKLCAIGLPALEFMLNKHLATSDRLQHRAFADLIKNLGAEGSAALAVKMFRASKPEIRNGLLIAIDAGASDIGSLLPPYFEDPELRMLAARAAGSLRSTASVDPLMRLCLSEDKLVVRAAIVALELIGDPSSLGTAQSMLRSGDPFVRESAVRLLGKHKEASMPVAQSLTREGSEQRVRLGVALLALIGSQEALNECGALLLDPRPGVRIDALRALNERCPQQYEQAFVALQSDPVSTVRSIAKTLRPSPVRR